MSHPNLSLLTNQYNHLCYFSLYINCILFIYILFRRRNQYNSIIYATLVSLQISCYIMMLRGANLINLTGDVTQLCNRRSYVCFSLYINCTLFIYISFRSRAFVSVPYRFTYFRKKEKNNFVYPALKLLHFIFSLKLYHMIFRSEQSSILQLSYKL